MSDNSTKKRKPKGSGSWDTVTRKGITYFRFRKKYEGQKSHKEFTGKSKAEVTRKVKQYEADIKEGKVLSVPIKISTERNIKTLGQATELMLERIKLSEKIGNYNTLSSTYHNYLEPYDIYEINLSAISQEDFEAYFNVLASKFSLSTIKKSRTLINRVFAFYNLPSLIQKIKLPKNENCAVKKKESDFLSLEEAEKFYEACFHKKQAGEHYNVSFGENVFGKNVYYLILILYTGMRVGECYGLQWKSYDRQTNTIRINKQKNRLKNASTGQYEWIVNTPKYPSSNRSIPVPERARLALEYLYNTTHHNKDNDYIVLSDSGIPPSQSALTRTLHCVMKCAGIYREGFGLHDLRHSYGSMLLEKGYEIGKPIDVKIISELLGHKDVSTTLNIYIHILQKQKVAAVNILDE